MELTDPKVKDALLRRRAKEFGSLAGLPEDSYKITVSQKVPSVEHTLIQVSLTDSLLKSAAGAAAGFEKFPKMVQFGIVTDQNFPLSAPRVQSFTNVTVFF